MPGKSNFHKGVFYASATALLWGVLAIVLKVSLKNFSPVDVAWARFFVAFILLCLYLFIRKPSSFHFLLRPPLLVFAGAACLGLNYLGFISGINLTTPGIAQIFIQAGPVLLALSGFIFFKEKASVRQITGLVLVFGGMTVFYHDQILILAENVRKYQIGVLWVIFGGVMWAFYAVIQKGLVRKHDPLQLNLVLFGLPAIGYLPFTDLQMICSASALDWGILIFLGCNTFLAYGSLAYAFKYLEANKVSVIITLNPIITLVLMGILTIMNVGWIIHEKLTPVSMAGASMVITGAVLTILKTKKSF
ncbi:MAG: DMT family transporter [Bacteroidales bacterium]|jgi:drug/metabolite transporter (DMT)-like permease